MEPRAAKDAKAKEISEWDAVVEQREDLRCAIRLIADVPTSYPICVAAGDEAPSLIGRSWYYTTPSGMTEIRHPNAYHWPKLYHHSTRRVTVGAEWLRKNADDILRPATTAPLRRSVLDGVGPQGEDDRIQPIQPRVIARSAEGLLLCDHRGARWWDDSTVVQVVVRDATTGCRHHITVPPRFCRPLRRGETWGERIHAALSWTFRLGPEEYHPEICA